MSRVLPVVVLVLFALPARADVVGQLERLVQQIEQDLSSDSPEVSAASTDLSVSDDLKIKDITARQKTALYELDRRLSKALHRYKRDHDESREDEERIREVQRILERALTENGISKRISAELVLGAARLDANAEGASVLGEEEDPSTEPHSLVRWESSHFGTSDRVEFVMGGRFGIRPTLGLFAPDSTVVSTENAIAKYEDALVFDIGGSLVAHLERSEFMMTVFGGVTRLVNLETLVDVDGKSIAATPIDNDSGRTAYLYGAGVEYRYYENLLTRVHAENRTLQPLLSISASVLSDRRFRPNGVLEDAKDPDHFLRASVLLNGIEVARPRSESEDSRTYSLSFGVEIEQGIGGSATRVSGARFFIRGDSDLMKLLTGSD